MRNGRDARRQAGVQHERHHMRLLTQFDDAWLKGLCFHFSRDLEKSARQVDHDAAKGHLGGDGILVRIRTDYECTPFARGLKNSEAGSVGVLKDDVSALRDLRQPLLLAGADIVPVPDIRRDDANRRVRRARSCCACGATTSRS